MYYKQFEISAKSEISEFDIEYFKGNFLRSYGDKIFHYDIADYDYLNLFFHHLKFKHKPDFIWYNEIYFNNYLGAHIDHGPECSLNYYIQCGEAVTSFYEVINNNPIKAQCTAPINTNNLYFEEDLLLVDSFKARDNTSFLLNASKVHSVKNIQTTRKFISWNWKDITFNEIAESIYTI